MATFSMGEALGSGFGLIGKRPLSVLAWGVAYLIVGVAPVVAMFALMGPDFLALIHDGQNAAASGAAWGGPPHFPAETFWRMQSRIIMFQPVVFLTSLAARAMLTGAVFRAVLEPKNRGLAYLRLGMKELWLGLLILASGILLVLFMIALAGVTAAVCIAIVAALKTAHVAAVWSGLAVAVCVVAAAVAVIHVCLRFSMAGPMTFADGEFRLFESWAITKGHTLKLFGLALVLGVLVVALTMIVQAIVLAIGFGALGMTHLNREAVEAFFRSPPQTWLAACGAVDCRAGRAVGVPGGRAGGDRHRALGGGLS